MRWVKTCHNGHDNDEDAECCQACGRSLFDIPSRVLPDSPSHESIREPRPADGAEPPPQASTSAPPDGPAFSPTHPAPTIEATTLHLEHLDTGIRLAIVPGHVLGREDPDLAHDPSRTVIPERWRGANFVSRQHCQFDYLGGQWCVTPLRRSSLATPNPTFINGQPVPIEDPFPLKSGDRLFLAELGFIVRIEG